MSRPSALQSESHRWSGRISGLRWDVERCPDARWKDAVEPGVVGGLGGLLLGGLSRATPHGRLLVAALGAAAGVFASRYHVNLDWDPDRLREAPLTPFLSDGEGRGPDSPDSPDSDDRGGEAPPEPDVRAR